MTSESVTEKTWESPMDVMYYQQTEREEQRMQVNREELVEQIAKATHTDGYIQPLPGIYSAASLRL